jgi:hypothetical protein
MIIMFITMITMIMVIRRRGRWGWRHTMWPCGNKRGTNASGVRERHG